MKLCDINLQKPLKDTPTSVILFQDQKITPVYSLRKQIIAYRKSNKQVYSKE